MLMRPPQTLLPLMFIDLPSRVVFMTCPVFQNSQPTGSLHLVGSSLLSALIFKMYFQRITRNPDLGGRKTCKPQSYRQTGCGNQGSTPHPLDPSDGSRQHD